jgi:hypothetical protein
MTQELCDFCRKTLVPIEAPSNIIQPVKVWTITTVEYTTEDVIICEACAALGKE